MLGGGDPVDIPPHLSYRGLLGQICNDDVTVYSHPQLLYSALQRQNAENLKQMFPEKEYRGFSPNFHIHVSVSELYIPTMGLPVLLEEICIVY